MRVQFAWFGPAVLGAGLVFTGCAAPPSPSQPSPSAASPGAIPLDPARHDPGSRHFDGRMRRSELVGGGRGAEVSAGESLSVRGGEDGVWQDPVAGLSAILRFTVGSGGPREGALDLSMDTGPDNAVTFSVDNRLGRDILLAPIMLRREAAGVVATPGRPCRLNDGIILGQRTPPGVFAVVVPASTAIPADAPACERGHRMFGD